jgi:hypothetical protein
MGDMQRMGQIYVSFCDLARAHRAACLAIAWFALTGCDDKLPDFGAPYAVGPKPEPVIEGNQLRLTTHFGSCGNATKFSLQHHVDRGTALIWARQDGRRQPCDMPESENLAFTLPDEVMKAKSVVLITPGGGRLTLRR